ncbi:MAG: hypothetical protein ACOCXC_05615 [Fibrobacterota bacterium]
MINSLSKLLIILILLGCSSYAKRRHSRFGEQGRMSGVLNKAPTSQELEQKFRPYLEQRAERVNREPRSRGRRHFSELPSRSDYYALLRSWEELSPQFRQLYKQATSIPSSFSSYLSPKGHFEVFYTTSGRDSVDITDTVGFGANGDWREKQNGPNGVPDYIDEAAFALDSSWTMFVERFGFLEPLAAPGPQGSSDRYKVMFMHQEDSTFYGLTHLYGRQEGSDRGYASHIEINSDWSHPSWAPYGYDKKPYDALRVTCAHELFHAVQYAMVWDVSMNVNLDTYPISWTEGTAVLMEELAFDYVNDYIQYANDFFLNPRITFLDANLYSGTHYLNSILLKYMYEKAQPADSIKLIRDIFFANYEEKTPFYTNLELQSKASGALWVDLLNGFHTESYFTGSRSRPGMFITDAEELDSWSKPPVSPSFESRTVKPYAMEIFSYKPLPHHTDTLKLFLKGQTGDENSRSWAASVIVIDDTATVLPVELNEDGEGSITLYNWKQRNECLVVATNGSSSQNRTMDITLESCPVTLDEGETQVHSSVSGSGTARLHVLARQPLGCEARLDTVTADSLLGRVFRRTLHPVSSFFNIYTPATWSGKADLSLAISVSRSHFESLHTSTDSVSLYRWNPETSEWELQNSKFQESDDSLSWTVQIEDTGIHAVLFRRDQKLSSNLNIFPNVLSLKAGKPLRIQGEAMVYEVKIYSMDGALVCHQNSFGQFSGSVHRDSRGGVEWNLKNNRGVRIAPGLYLVAVSALDESTMDKTTIKRKVMIVP